MEEYEVYYDETEESYFFVGVGGFYIGDIKSSWVQIGIVVAQNLEEALEKFDYEYHVVNNNTSSDKEIPSGLMLDIVDLNSSRAYRDLKF